MISGQSEFAYSSVTLTPGQQPTKQWERKHTTIHTAVPAPVPVPVPVPVLASRISTPLYGGFCPAEFCWFDPLFLRVKICQIKGVLLRARSLLRKSDTKNSDMEHRNWTVGPSLAISRSQTALAAFDGKLFAVGGKNDLQKTGMMIQIAEMTPARDPKPGK